MKSTGILREQGLPQNQFSADFAKLDEVPSVQKMQAGIERARGEARQACASDFVAALPHSMMGMRETKPADCPIHIRGEDSQLGDVVPRGFPRVLTTAETQAGESGAKRTAATRRVDRRSAQSADRARDGEPHLAASLRHRTGGDAGRLSARRDNRPATPRCSITSRSRFIAHGWSVKKLIAEIMSSRVYQLGTAHDAKAL